MLKIITMHSFSNPYKISYHKLDNINIIIPR